MDFGVSKIIIEKSVVVQRTISTGTVDYNVPEIFEEGLYTESIDLWGCWHCPL